MLWGKSSLLLSTVSGCCQASWVTHTAWRCQTAEVTDLTESFIRRGEASWWIWMYSALLFVYSLYTEILVCIFKDFLCDIRHSELNHNIAQLRRGVICVLCRIRDIKVLHWNSRTATVYFNSISSQHFSKTQIHCLLSENSKAANYCSHSQM